MKHSTKTAGGRLGLRRAFEGFLPADDELSALRAALAAGADPVAVALAAIQIAETLLVERQHDRPLIEEPLRQIDRRNKASAGAAVVFDAAAICKAFDRLPPPQRKTWKHARAALVGVLGEDAIPQDFAQYMQRQRRAIRGAKPL